MSELSAAALQSEPFLLIAHTVTDLEAIQADPDAYFVSMYADPQQAASLWRKRLKDNPAGCDGYLRLSYQGQTLIGPRLWGEVSSIWYSLVGVVASYLATGEGKDCFPDQPVVMRLYQAGRRHCSKRTRTSGVWIRTNSSRIFSRRRRSTSPGLRSTSAMMSTGPWRDRPSSPGLPGPDLEQGSLVEGPGPTLSAQAFFCLRWPGHPSGPAR